MKVQIKLLERDPFLIEVTPDIIIRAMKEMMYNHLRIPIEEQRLIFCGQILHDDKMLNSYFEIKEGSKIHLVMITKKKYPLYKKMYEILRPHYTEKETQKILGIFMRKIYDSFKQLSLDDLERIAREATTEKSTVESEKMIVDDDEIK